MIPNGSYDLINGSVGYLSTVIYKCNEGFEMIGRAMLTCDIDERWNGPPPRCEPIECDELPGVFENARIVSVNGTVEYGAKAEIVCPNGFKPDGPRYISCLSTGQWSAPLLPCIRGKFNLNQFQICITLTNKGSFSLLDSRVSVPQQTTYGTTPKKPTRTSSRYTTTPITTTEYEEGNHQNFSKIII